MSMPKIKEMTLEDAEGPEWDSMVGLAEENKEYLGATAFAVKRAVDRNDTGLLLTGLATMMYEAYKTGRQSIIDEQEAMK